MIQTIDYPSRYTCLNPMNAQSQLPNQPKCPYSNKPGRAPGSNQVLPALFIHSKIIYYGFIIMDYGLQPLRSQAFDEISSFLDTYSPYPQDLVTTIQFNCTQKITNHVNCSVHNTGVLWRITFNIRP